VEVLTRVRENGGITVAITNTEGSPVDRSAEYRLNCEAGEEICVTATKSYITQLTLMTALAAHVSGNEHLLENCDRLAAAVEAAIKLESNVAQLVGYYRFIDHIFLISRGYSYGVVAEAELKVQETSYIRAMGYSTADYTHGPIALAKPSSPYVFSATDQHTDHNVMELYEKIARKGALCACITNKPELSERFPLSILLPAWCEGILGSFAAATVFQLFASYLSVSLGHNPDSPAGIGKVNITR
jgi:glucosamine--fructose-6-phosphate aminotransferase (isomerizing)